MPPFITKTSVSLENLVITLTVLTKSPFVETSAEGPTTYSFGQSIFKLDRALRINVFLETLIL